MNEFKFFQNNPIYKTGNVVAVICNRNQDFLDWCQKKRRNSTVSSLPTGKFNTIDGVKYLKITRPRDIRGYRLNHVITLDNANQNPYYDEIIQYIQPCLVNERV